MTRLALCAVLFVVFVAAPRLAWASDAASIAIVVEGMSGERLASAIGGKLPEPWSRADGPAFAKLLRANGQAAALGPSLDSAKTRSKTIDRFAKAARDARARAVLVVRPKPGKGARSAAVLLLDADAAMPAVDADVALGASPDGDADAIVAAVSSELGRIAPKPKPVAEPAARVPPAATEMTAPPPPSGDAPSARPLRGQATATIDVSAGIDLASRHLSYHDALTSSLRPYDVDGVPTAAFAIEIYPAARSEIAVLRDLGLVGDYRRAIGLESSAPNGARVSTEWSRFDLGLRARWRLSGRTPIVLGLSGSYGRETFKLGDAATVGGQLPSVAYSLLRAKLDARLPLGPVALLGAFAYLHVLDAGDVAAGVRDARTRGIEALLGLAVPFAAWIEARLSADYARFFYSFHPRPGDATVAGGALDQILRGQVAMAFFY